MGEVYLSVSMSLDGYVAGPGDDVEALHRWLFDGGNPSPHGDGLRLSEPSCAVIDETLDATGATVAGRRTYEVSRGWGGRTPFPMPYFNVSHDVPEDMVREDATLMFVTDGVEAAIARAKGAAGDKKVNVMGAEVSQQAMCAGLLDEVQSHLISVLIGAGKRLFEHLGTEPVDLERTRVVEAPEGVTHLRFRIRR
jgi:dihydrofolate reductase